jgi:hypothetical protein
MRYLLPALLLLPLLLTGCDDTKKALGFEKSVPDEYRVVSHPPLSLPPEYALRPPRAGAAGPQDMEAPDRAQRALIGPPSETKNLKNGEKDFLEEAGIDKVPPDIRETISSETHTLNTDPDFWEKLKTGSLIVDPKKDDTSKRDILNPKQEKAREQKASQPEDSKAKAPSEKDADKDGVTIE